MTKRYHHKFTMEGNVTIEYDGDEKFEINFRNPTTQINAVNGITILNTSKIITLMITEEEVK